MSTVIGAADYQMIATPARGESLRVIVAEWQ